MRMEPTARQICSMRQMPVRARYHISEYRGRMRAGNSFAEEIIVKYMDTEEPDLPSVTFAYPENVTGTMEELLSRLVSQLITLYRIKVKVNVRNYRFLQQLAVSANMRCHILFRELEARNLLSPNGVSAESVRDLRRIFEGLRLPERMGSQEIKHFARPEASASIERLKQESESTFLLRVLTAASRGNSTRERYLSTLYQRLADSPRAGEILGRAVGEIFRIGKRAPGMSVWASEQARQFFWRIARAPEQERRFFLQAGGFRSIVELGNILQTMDRRTFRQFSSQLLERFSFYVSEPEYIFPGEIGFPPESGQDLMESAETFLEQMKEEEWEYFTNELHSAGFIFRENGLEQRTIKEEKELLLRTLKEESDTVKVLRQMILETIYRVSVLRENQKAYLSLAESILNLNADQWGTFRKELSGLRKTDEDFRQMLPDPELLMLEERGQAEAETGVLHPEEYDDIPQEERILREQGIRMSAEKMTFLQKLYESSHSAETVFLRNSEKLLLQTIIGEGSGQTFLQPSFRNMTGKERESWLRFMKELIREPEMEKSLTGSRKNSAVSSLALLAGQAAFTDGGMKGAEAAAVILEHLREARTTAREAGTTARETGAIDLTASVPLVVNRPAIARDMRAEAAAAASAAAERVLLQSRTERIRTEQQVFHDIEFETVNRVMEEKTVRETGQALQEVMKKLEAQQAEIERIRKKQESRSPGELIKKLDEKIRMEKLRGGV